MWTDSVESDFILNVGQKSVVLQLKIELIKCEWEITVIDENSAIGVKFMYDVKLMLEDENPKIMPHVMISGG